MKNGVKKFTDEFKAFISKGNVVDMSVAVVVGGAFGKIVTSLVNNIIMPLVSLLTHGINVSEWKWVIKEAVIENGTVVAEETALGYGLFIQSVIDFLIIAFCIFVFLRLMLASKEKFSKKKIADDEKSGEKADEPAVPTETELLCEIRDILKNQSQEN